MLSLPVVCPAQAPRPERLEPCASAVVVSAEHYSLDGGVHGGGGSADGVFCTQDGGLYSAGAASYAIADAHWSFARGAGSWKPRDDTWLALDAAAGSGREGSGHFGYLTLRDSITQRWTGRWFAKLEHQYIDIDKDRGNLARASASVLAHPSLLIELAATRSFSGNLGTRSVSSRADWVRERWRVYAGGATGRVLPHAVDIISGDRAPDEATREWFGGAAVTLGTAELHLAFDEQRTGSSARRTVALALRWPLP